MKGWHDYDPDWLVRLAKEQLPQEAWLHEAISRCRVARMESAAYIHFVNPANPNMPGSEWQFQKNIVLNDPKQGELVLDILKDGRVGGVEFVNKIEQ
jgi:hypothetical protein